jgi:hypothetical protein
MRECFSTSSALGCDRAWRLTENKKFLQKTANIRVFGQKTPNNRILQIKTKCATIS